METKNTSIKYEEVLRGVATLCSKRTKDSMTGDLEKEPAKAQMQGSSIPCVRYSGAARWKHKRQLQKEAGEKAVQANTQQTDAAADSPRTEEGGLSNTHTHDQTPACLVPQVHNRIKSPRSLCSGDI